MYERIQHIQALFHTDTRHETTDGPLRSLLSLLRLCSPRLHMLWVSLHTGHVLRHSPSRTHPISLWHLAWWHHAHSLIVEKMLILS